MDLIKTAEEIESRIKLLESMRKHLKERGEEKANAIAEYDKAMAVKIAELRLRDKTPTSIIDKLARGECADQRLKLELAESAYKSLTSNMNAVQAELNAYQSIYRHMD